MHIVFFEDKTCGSFLPLTYTRPVSMLRMGLFTMRDRWAKSGFEIMGDITRHYLQHLFPEKKENGTLYVNARLFPDEQLLVRIRHLQRDEQLVCEGILLAKVVGHDSAVLIDKLTDLFSKNGLALLHDFQMATRSLKSAAIDPSNTILGNRELIFLADGAQVLASTLNTTHGPIYLDKNSEVMEGSHIRGPFYLGEHSTLKMGSKIYGPTTIGPHCKVGGEVSNSVIQGYSNKAHDGFIGNTVIGEWCNLGADTNTSNLKNNYGRIKTWHYDTESMEDTGLTFCGLVMGDHSKCGINTMFNTGTVVGVGANIFGGNFPPKHVASFSWGGSSGFQEYAFEKMLSTAMEVYKRRGLILSVVHQEILLEVFRLTAKHRQDATQSQESI
jgi:UDP-N-acetylglucosamine diphosphorylase/glucosamine-1-phosphate N-acetyltransferase